VTALTRLRQWTRRLRLYLHSNAGGGAPLRSAVKRIAMSRRNITIAAFAIGLVLTVGCLLYVWNHKDTPPVRFALWCPFAYLLNITDFGGLFLSLIQFPLLACAFALAIRRWPARWVLATFLATYGLYAAVIIAKLGPPK
jgi:hypothetical protein